MKYICEHCRNQVTDSQKYCHECGNMFDSIVNIGTFNKYYEDAVDEFGIDVKDNCKDKEIVKEYLGKLYDDATGPFSKNIEYKVGMIKRVLEERGRKGLIEIYNRIDDPVKFVKLSKALIDRLDINSIKDMDNMDYMRTNITKLAREIKIKI